MGSQTTIADREPVRLLGWLVAVVALVLDVLLIAGVIDEVQHDSLILAVTNFVGALSVVGAEFVRSRVISRATALDRGYPDPLGE